VDSRHRYALRALVLVSLYALLVAIDRRWGRKAAFAAFGLAIGVAIAARVSGCGGSTAVATFNIRDFGAETDMKRLAALVREVDPDVLAIQEVQDPKKPAALARALTTGDRRYAAIVSRCGGKLKLALLHDTTRVRLTGTEEIPELDPDRGRCDEGDRPALVARFERDGRPFRLVVVHLAAGGERERVERRKEQWKKIHALVARLRAASSDPVVVLGDVNSTGYLDDAHGERTFLRESTKAAGLSLETDGLACTEYFKTGDRELSPSVLDHVVSTPGAVRFATPKVHGYCAALSCRRHQGAPPSDYTEVSDHCPVSFRVKTGLF